MQAPDFHILMVAGALGGALPNPAEELLCGSTPRNHSCLSPQEANQCQRSNLGIPRAKLVPQLCESSPRPWPGSEGNACVTETYRNTVESSDVVRSLEEEVMDSGSPEQSPEDWEMILCDLTKGGHVSLDICHSP